MKISYLLLLLVLSLGFGACQIYPFNPKPSPTATASPASPTPSTPPALESNFSKQGALVAREDAWYLVWDEPGNPAANAKLNFTPQSICLLGGENKDCGLINNGPESYDRVSLEGNNNNNEVTVIKVEELKSSL